MGAPSSNGAVILSEARSAKSQDPETLGRAPAAKVSPLSSSEVSLLLLGTPSLQAWVSSTPFEGRGFSPPGYALPRSTPTYPASFPPRLAAINDRTQSPTNARQIPAIAA